MNNEDEDCYTEDGKKDGDEKTATWKISKNGNVVEEVIVCGDKKEIIKYEYDEFGEMINTTSLN